MCSVTFKAIQYHVFFVSMILCSGYLIFFSNSMFSFQFQKEIDTSDNSFKAKSEVLFQDFFRAFDVFQKLRSITGIYLTQ